MVPASLVAYFISRRFGMEEGTLGTIMASAQFVSSIGNMFASSVAKRIGLVRTSQSSTAHDKWGSHADNRQQWSLLIYRVLSFSPYCQRRRLYS